MSTTIANIVDQTTGQLRPLANNDVFQVNTIVPSSTSALGHALNIIGASANTGSRVSIQGGTSILSGIMGGEVDIVGASSTDQQGGSVRIIGGDVLGAGNFNAGIASVEGGTATNNGIGGEARLISGAGAGSGSGGQINIVAGQGGATGDGGIVQITGGAGGATSGAAGDVDINGGTSTSVAGGIRITGGNGNFGGSITMLAGNSLSNNPPGNIQGIAGQNVTGVGGEIVFQAGPGGTAGGPGGPIILAGGDATTGGNFVGGPATLEGGGNSGSGTAGTASVLGGPAHATGIGGIGLVRGGDSSLTVGSSPGEAQVIGGDANVSGATGGRVSINGGGGNVPGANGGPIVLTSGAVSNGDGNAGSIIIAANGTSGAGNGGSIIGQAGQSGTTGTAGNITFTAGVGGATSGDGGIATLQGGSGTNANANGGSAFLIGGSGQGSGQGATSRVKGGLGGGTGNGGEGQVIGGLGGSSSGNGGAAIVAGGSANTSGSGGIAAITGGDGVGNNQAAGGITIDMGNSTGNATESIIFKGPPTGGSGSGANASVTIMTLANSADLFFENVTGNKTIVPRTDNTWSLGTNANRFALVRAVTITSGAYLEEEVFPEENFPATDRIQALTQELEATAVRVSGPNGTAEGGQLISGVRHLAKIAMLAAQSVLNLEARVRALES